MVWFNLAEKCIQDQHKIFIPHQEFKRAQRTKQPSQPMFFNFSAANNIRYQPSNQDPRVEELSEEDDPDFQPNDYEEEEEQVEQIEIPARYLPGLTICFIDKQGNVTRKPCEWNPDSMKKTVRELTGKTKKQNQAHTKHLQLK